ncbi:D-cysteine desulfhydrase family protein [Microbacterium sp. No. 7]|uniref:D-cysteine desulfhydrase family protein n=1 Tax=Microbacterium sp. No. 7 TaxID=1714373 RepID=UPI0009E87FA5|nr:D-cysteine desulfhydrase family protein [Microbacterium sp. No. 7]
MSSAGIRDLLRSVAPRGGPSLVVAPTPLQPLHRLRTELGDRGPRLWIKRDDLTGLALGGNKARKLRYLVADARAAGADTLVTVGAAQSNHARQTAAAAAAAGLDAVLVLRVPPGASAAYRASGNVLLDRLFGARLVLVDETPDDPHPERAAADAVVAELTARGRRPYLIPSGGSTAVGALGYVEAFAEIAEAEPAFDAIVLATGSGGTQAGLLAGAALADGAARIEAVAVSPDADELGADVERLAVETLALLGAQTTPPAVRIDAGFVGPGYGVVTDAGIEAIGLFARTEGIVLDPVYTGKAAAALIDGIRSGRFDADDDVLFLHTGGAPALFAHEPTLTAAFTS